MVSRMKWVSALSEAPQLPVALDEIVAQLRRQLDGQAPDLLIIFVSSEFRSAYESISTRLNEDLKPRTTLGCSGGGVVGDNREVEHRPALAVTAALLPGVKITPFRVSEGSLPGLDVSPKQWHSLVGVPMAENPQFLLLADPFSIHIENLIQGLDFAYPKSVKVGGLASGATQAGDNALFLNKVCYRTGAVGVALTGNIVLDTLVAQGCRPIGKPMRITKCDRNILMELDGETPLDVLRNLYTTLDARDQQLLQHALFLGLVMDPMKTHFSQGDFLVRNIVGLDTQKGILAAGALLRQGQLVQFHLRDAQTSIDDLEHILTSYRSRASHDQVAGALLFSCLGRGEYLYGHRNHDTQLFQEKMGQIPVGGFFCNGEIGPVAGTTYLHGYTSCFALFRPLYVTDISSSVQPDVTSHPLPPRSL
jgi:small ligand-binding sensory domain FIST